MTGRKGSLPDVHGSPLLGSSAEYVAASLSVYLCQVWDQGGTSTDPYSRQATSNSLPETREKESGIRKTVTLTEETEEGTHGNGDLTGTERRTNTRQGHSGKDSKPRRQRR